MKNRKHLNLKIANSTTKEVRVSVGILSLLLFFPIVALAEDANRTVFPKDPKILGAQVGTTYAESKPGQVEIMKAPAGAPNVVVILLDDVGFAASSTFGGPIPTPNIDQLAAQGLRYNNFNTTALCSPSRAALLTGRNHHSVNMGAITEQATGFEGYTTMIPKSAATIAEILKNNGYNTAAFGKWHNTPPWEVSPAGPFDRWPTGLGFERFYGFNAAETNQYFPSLYDGTVAVEPSRDPKYMLTPDLVNKAIDWVHGQQASAPDKPYFLYFAPGATHAPHHAPPEWVAKFRGKFDQGYDKQREITYQNQLKMGIIPAGTQLTPRPKQLIGWEQLTPDQKEVSARLMETYAGFLAHTDAEIGRLIDSLKQTGKWDNTLVFYIVGDNGASAEGSPYGVFNENSTLNDLHEDPARLVSKMDLIGGPKAYNHYNTGWAWAMDTPFQWTKQIASHFGGTRNGMVVLWPKRIKGAGLRSQFSHVIDIAPTILEATSIPAPTTVDGIAQKPIEGTSILYTFNQPTAQTAHTKQYFEMLTNRGIYKDGWTASVFHGKLPWEALAPGGIGFANEKWELYNVDHDFSQAVNLASQNPDKLKELQEDFLAEAKKFNVLPLDERTEARLDLNARAAMLGQDPKLGTQQRTHFAYYPGTVRLANGPNFFNKSYTITADTVLPAGQTPDGILMAVGAIEGGFAFYAKAGKLCYGYNYALQRSNDIVCSTEPLQSGAAQLKVSFDYDGGGVGKGGMVRLFENNRPIGQAHLESTLPMAYSLEGVVVDIGEDAGSPVLNGYPGKGKFPFNAKIKQVVVELDNSAAPKSNITK